MKRDYLSRLARWARWYLPPAEAAEVLEDYQEIVAGRTKEELERDLGTPRAVARQLAQPKAYRRWLMVFLALAICIVFPVITPLWQELAFKVFLLFHFYLFWDIGEITIPIIWAFFAAGMGLSLMCLRSGGEKKGVAAPKGVLPLLALLLAGMVYQWFLAWMLLAEPVELLRAITVEGVKVMRLALDMDIFAMVLIGLLGLVKARLNSCRWGAVYVLGLSGVILGLSVWGLMISMNLSLAADSWQAAYLTRYLFITLVGLVGTAVSLC